MTEDFTGPEPGEDGGWGTAPLAPPKPADAGKSVRRAELADSLSSIEIHENAKLEPSIKVRVYAESNTFEAVDKAANHAADLYKRLRGQVRSER